MKIFYSALPKKRLKCLAAIGVFDGIHKGHRYILKNLYFKASKIRLPALLISFDISPRKFLSSKEKNFEGYLTDNEDKAVIASSLGIRYIWFLKTNRGLLKMKPADFIDYLYRYFDIREVFAGEDFRFGFGASAGTAGLKKLLSARETNLTVLKKKRVCGKVVSSSLIRSLLKEGKVREAKLFLGRTYFLKGRVTKGLGLGRKLGFPTANLGASGYAVPGPGVYAAFCFLGRRASLCAVNIGFRPTFAGNEKLSIEVHVIKESPDLLGKTLKVFFIDKLREEKRFPSAGALKTAISEDIKHILSKYSVPALRSPQVIVS